VFQFQKKKNSHSLFALAHNTSPRLSLPATTNTTMTSSADRINLGELTSQLANAEARVCEWASAAGKRADAARLEHGRSIAALRGKGMGTFVLSFLLKLAFFELSCYRRLVATVLIAAEAGAHGAKGAIVEGRKQKRRMEKKCSTSHFSTNDNEEKKLDLLSLNSLSLSSKTPEHPETKQQ
jgi:hypothetical protein